ncbi:hypothetical protein [Acidicapsa ligni]
MWNLSLGKGSLVLSNPNRAIGTIVNDWTHSTVSVYQSGTPVGINTGYFYTCNTSCWQNIPTRGLYDLAETINQISTQTIANIDLSLQKGVWIRDNICFRLRLDTFNALNTVLFPGPNTNPGDCCAHFITGSGWTGFWTVPEIQQNFPRALQVSGKTTF